MTNPNPRKSIARGPLHRTGRPRPVYSGRSRSARRGEDEVATALLGKAVKLAHDSGNEATAKLLRHVVDVQDEEKGTVRLKSDVAKTDAMALETRSTKTSRIPKQM